MVRKVLNVCIVVFTVLFSLISCGGGAGGASIPTGEYTTHNNSGWGGNGSNGSNGGSNNGVNTTGGTPIVVANYVYNGNSYSKDQINDLIQVIRDNPGQPEGVFTVQFYVEGDSDPRYARVTKTSNGVEKFEHQYKATCTNSRDTTNFPVTISFYKDEGINLSTQTASNMAGWRCSGNNQLYGSFITGMQGDVTLNAEFATFTATPTQTELTASCDYTDTVRTRATITITNGTGSYTLTPADSYLDVEYTDPSTYTYTVKLASNLTHDGFIWFPDNTHSSVTITEDSTGEEQILDFTLNNEYQYQVTLSATDDEEGTGYSSSFMTAQSVLCSDAISNIASSRIKAGRSVVALKNTVASPQIVYLPSQTISFNSTDFNSRQIALQGVLDFTISAKDATNASWSGATSFTNASNQTGMRYTLEKNSNTTKELKISLSDYSDLANLSASPTSTATYLDIGAINSSGEFTVKLTGNITHDSIPDSGYTYTIAITDDGTSTTKYIHVKVARPGECSYSLVYAKSDGTIVQIPGWQNIDFTPGNILRFGVAEGVSTLKMGDLDSTLTGLEAAISITGWKSTRASNPPIYNNPFPNVAPADCESDKTITLIATTDYSLLLGAYRQNENDVQTGDIVLSNGKVLDKSNTFTMNRSSVYYSYWIGTVCVRSGDRKFVVAKKLSSNYNMAWSNTKTNVSSLKVTISGTQTSSYPNSTPEYDTTAAVTFNPDSSGKNSRNYVSINSFPAFKFCADYGSSSSLPSGTDSAYTSGWYLPSIAEAYELYNQGVVTGTWIVSSSQFNQDRYWIMVGNQNEIVTWSKTEADNRADIYPCHELVFVTP